jgi:hypothetical protein
MSVERMQVVLAWADPSVEIVEPGRPDLGRHPITRPTLIGHACTWILDGDAADLEHARAHAERKGPHARVYTFSAKVEDTLTVTVEQINGDFYAFGSELACLRLFYKFRAVEGARAEYSSNLDTWFFTKPSV